MDSLELIFTEGDVKSNPSEDTAGVKDGTCVGIDLRAWKRLYPNGDKLANNVMETVDLFNMPFAAPLEVASYSGTMPWFDFVNRWMLSCLDRAYSLN